jgi:hypothetical protein
MHVPDKNNPHGEIVRERHDYDRGFRSVKKTPRDVNIAGCELRFLCQFDYLAGVAGAGAGSAGLVVALQEVLPLQPSLPLHDPLSP